MKEKLITNIKIGLCFVVLTGCISNDASMKPKTPSKQMDSLVEFLTRNEAYLAVPSFREEASMDGRDFVKNQQRFLLNEAFFKNPHETFLLQKPIITPNFIVYTIYLVRADGLFWIEGSCGIYDEKIRVFGPVTFDELKADTERRRASETKKMTSYSKEMREFIDFFEKNKCRVNLPGNTINSSSMEFQKNEALYEKFSIYPPVNVADALTYIIYRHQTDGAFLVRMLGGIDARDKVIGPMTFDVLKSCVEVERIPEKEKASP